MPKKILQYQCLRCDTVFAATPGPIDCPKCAHKYVMIIDIDTDTKS